MNVAFRVDASRLTGSGHVTRCMALASAFVARGSVTTFVTRELPAHLRSWLASQRHDVLDLPERPAVARHPEEEWSLEQQQLDARQTLACLAARAVPDLVIVDHYGLGWEWESAMRAADVRLMAIDDKARRHCCDILLDQNLHADMEARYRDRLPVGCRALLGPAYALLRPEFARLRQSIAPRDGTIGRVFVLFGGTDPHDLTSRAVAAVHSCDPQLSVDVVIGADHPDPAGVITACARYGYSCHVQSTRVAELMATADLAIGAGGSASWERCCLGLATISVAIAENQIDITMALAGVGAGVHAGDRDAATVRRMAGLLSELQAQPQRVATMSARAFDLVDGRGCERVIDALGLSRWS